jgi:hypothetical protein
MVFLLSWPSANSNDLFLARRTVSELLKTVSEQLETLGEHNRSWNQLVWGGCFPLEPCHGRKFPAILRPYRAALLRGRPFKRPLIFSELSALLP